MNRKLIVMLFVAVAGALCGCMSEDGMTLPRFPDSRYLQKEGGVREEGSYKVYNAMYESWAEKDKIIQFYQEELSKLGYQGAAAKYKDGSRSGFWSLNLHKGKPRAAGKPAGKVWLESGEGRTFIMMEEWIPKSK